MLIKIIKLLDQAIFYNKLVHVNIISFELWTPFSDFN